MPNLAGKLLSYKTMKFISLIVISFGSPENGEYFQFHVLFPSQGTKCA